MGHSSKRALLPLAGLALCLLWAGATFALTEDERNNIEIYQKLAPGVVNITSTVLEQDFFFNAIPRQPGQDRSSTPGDTSSPIIMSSRMRASWK